MGDAFPKALGPLLEALKKTGRFRIYVETGTADGDAALLAGDLFDTVITLEADPELAAAAHERLSGRKGVLPVAGDSRELLPRLLPRLAGPAVFRLNARPCGEESMQDGQACPLLAAIAAVTASPQPHVVLIEAGRLSADPTAPPETARNAVLAALGAGSDRDAALVDDVLIAVPRASAALWDALFPDGRPAFLVPPQA